MLNILRTFCNCIFMFVCPVNSVNCIELMKKKEKKKKEKQMCENDLY